MNFSCTWIRLVLEAYRLPVDFVIEWLLGKHGASVVECAPFGVDDRRAPRGHCGAVTELGDVGNLL